jgi:rhomboid protease GluP
MESSLRASPSPSSEADAGTLSPAPAVPPQVEPRKPWLTWLMVAACLTVFAGVRLSGDEATWEHFARWGAPPSTKIWHGAYWGLVTSAFVHFEIWHLAFNLYWLWVFGRVVEAAIGPLRWLAFFVGAAIVGSSAELAAAGETGIGLSGVIYAVFGFLWVSRRRRPEFAAVVPLSTANLFLGWFVFCVLATRSGFFQVANAAHAGGLAFGLACGWEFTVAPRAPLPKAAVAVLLAGSLVPLFWCPWQFQWVAMKAYDAHLRGDYRAAVDWYRRAERFEQQPAWVLRNLAFVYTNLGDSVGYDQTMKRLRRIDPSAAPETEAPAPTRTPSD